MQQMACAHSDMASTGDFKCAKSVGIRGVIGQELAIGPDTLTL